MHNIYYDASRMRAEVASGQHRNLIGGLWEKMGQHQLEFLIEEGLEPRHRLLDIGCGSLRLGVKAIAYLDSDRYFGSDVSGELIKAGYELELSERLQQKCAPSNFAVNGNFDFSFLPAPVDIAMAQSVFTHLPLNHLRRCLSTLADKMVQDGKFYVSFFECGENADMSQPVEQAPADELFGAGVVTYDYKDPYHYKVADLAWAADPRTWTLRALGDWGHPRNQRMVCYVRQ